MCLEQWEEVRSEPRRGWLVRVRVLSLAYPLAGVLLPFLRGSSAHQPRRAEAGRQLDGRGEVVLQKLGRHGRIASLVFTLRASNLAARSASTLEMQGCNAHTLQHSPHLRMVRMRAPPAAHCTSPSLLRVRTSRNAGAWLAALATAAATRLRSASYSASWTAALSPTSSLPLSGC